MGCRAYISFSVVSDRFGKFDRTDVFYSFLFGPAIRSSFVIFLVLSVLRLDTVLLIFA